MKSKLKTLAAASLLVVSSTAAQAAELITNGGFEAGLSGWTVTPDVFAFNVNAYAGPGIGGINSYQSADGPVGLKAAEFGAAQLPGGTISQTFATVVGASYSLSFLYGAFAGGSAIGPRQKLGIEIYNALVGGPANPTFNYSVTTRGIRDLSDMVSAESASFTALSALTRLTFRDMSATSINVDGILDTVSLTGPVPVAAVPEPSTYALMLAGLAVMGFIGRRRING
jgi:hypothetical protein